MAQRIYSCSLHSQLFASLTVAKKPLQLQAKPAVKGKPTANDSLQLRSNCRLADNYEW